MRPHSTALRDFLDSWSPLQANRIADLYTFTLATGEVLRFSGYQTGLHAPEPGSDDLGVTDLFVKGPGFVRGRISEQVGVQVDELEIEVHPGPADLIGTLTWQYALWAGLFDGATCRLDRVYMTSAGTAVGTITRFYGDVADVELGRTKPVMKVKSLLHRLNALMPKRLWQASCTFVFGDAMCQFDRATMQADVVAEGASDQLHIEAGLSPSPSTLYDNGTIIGVSGLNAGYRRNIGKLISGTVYFLKPWAFPVALGDGFSLLPGCPHTLDACTNIFGNQIHFGGFPYIPPPESAI